MIILGISGKKRSGKNMVADLISEIVTGVKHYAYADVVKRTAAVSLGLPVNYFFDDMNKIKAIQVSDDNYMLGRQILQNTGKYLRAIDKDILVFSVMNSIKNDAPDIAIITDVRLPHEYDSIKNAGGFIIRVDRNTQLQDDTDITETALDSHTFDYLINNNHPKNSPAIKQQILQALLKLDIIK